MTYKFFSWNINGIRAILKKGNLEELIKNESPDFICLQEIKAKREQLSHKKNSEKNQDLPLFSDVESDQNETSSNQDPTLPDFEEYEEIWNSAKRPGYSGTAIFSKHKPLSIETNLPDEIVKKYTFKDAYGTPLDEGRLLSAEFDKFYLVTVYTPNSKRNLSRLNLRENAWDKAFLEYLKNLEKKKPVIVCGDFNAAHEEIDLARPKDNQRNAGFTVEERQGITNIISANLIDTFRSLHPKEQKFTWWSNLGHAREKGIGWRIDYFFISKSLESKLKSAEIHDNYLGSDHCPISIELEI